MGESSVPSRKSSQLQWLGAGLVLALVPLLLLALALPPTRGKYVGTKQDWVIGLSIALSIASLLAYLVPNPLFPRRKSILPLIVLATSLLVACNGWWNKSFRQYVRDHGYSREVFRKAMHRTYHWPIYGRYDNALARWDEAGRRYSYATLPWVLASSAVAAAWFAWALRRPLERRWDARSFAVLIGLQLAMIFFFALCEPWPDRLSLRISGYNEFRKDITAFDGVPDTLRNYVARMPTLEWYGQHYPPGNLVLLTIERLLGIPGFTKTIVCLLTALSAVPLYQLAVELRLRPAARTAAVLLFAASTGVLIFCTINTTSLLLFPGTVCLWMLVRGMKTGGAAPAVWLGIAFAVYLFFSFSASILGVLMALTAILAWLNGATTTRNLLRTGAISLLTVGLAIALLYITTRFNLIACFTTAVRGHQTQQGNEGFDTLQRWWLRSTGNLLAYAMSIVPISVLAASGIVAVWRDRKRERQRDEVGASRMAAALVIAAGATVLIASFSGLFYAETERIWIFLTPAFALAAGHELARRSELEGRSLIYVMFALVLLISCSQEFLFMHYR